MVNMNNSDQMANVDESQLFNEEIDKAIKELDKPAKAVSPFSTVFKMLHDRLENPDKIGMSTYRNMWQTDETIQTGIEFIALSGMAMLGEYTHHKASIQKFVRQQIANLQEAWFDFLEDILSDGCTYGYGVTQICFTSSGEKVNLSRLIGMDVVGGRFRIDNQPGSPNLGRIVSYIPSNEYLGGLSLDEEIPAEKILHWSHRSRHSNPFGSSRLRPAWKWWVIKDQMLKAWAVTMERCGSPLTWISTQKGSEKMIDPDTGEEVTRREYLLSVLEDLQNTTGFVLDGEEKTGSYQVPRSISTDFEKIINHCDSRIYRALLIPVLLFDTAEIGSNALARQHFQVYIMSMNRTMLSLVPLIIRSIFRPLIYANFGEQDDYGTFEVKEMSEENAKLLSDIFYSLTTLGYLSPKIRSDMDMVRKKFNIHRLTDLEFEEIKEINETEAPEVDSPAEAGTPDPESDKSPPPPGGRKGNPAGPKPEKPGTRTTPRRPTTKQGRPKK